MDYPERIKNLRLALGLSQRDLAQRFKVQHAAVSQWESGKRKVSGPIIVLLEMMESDLQEGRLEKRKTLQKIQSGTVLRTFEASKTLSKVAIQSGKGTIVSFLSQFETGQQIERQMGEALGASLVDKLGDFKGLYMKVGQMLSYLPFILPEESRKKLEALQDKSTPLNPESIEKLVVTELGGPIETFFDDWDPLPFAAASVAQVHRAILKNGTEVAVKVQYPEIKKIIKSDLSNAALAELVINVIYRKHARGTLLKEMKERFLQECDFNAEAKHQEQFRQLFKSNKKVKIPKVFPEFCTEKILTSEFCEGQRFSDFAATASQDRRSQAATTLYEFAYQSIFKHRIFNCDPHPGNYLFTDDIVVFLDFGCVKKFSAEFIKLWKAQQKALLQGKDKALDDITIEMGLVSNEEKFDFEYHRKILKIVAAPVLEESYRFNRDFVEKTWRALVIDNPNRYYMNLPADWLFTNRLQWGLFSVLAELKADVPCRDIFLDWIEG